MQSMTEDHNQPLHSRQTHDKLSVMVLEQTKRQERVKESMGKIGCDDMIGKLKIEVIADIQDCLTVYGSWSSLSILDVFRDCFW
ncbi:hypothetical protein CN373_07375 [Bacillus cereus]|nr:MULTISPECIES: hypothetical protein [Bacillus cereus group]PFA22894.1 hypothetical protein CN373_07375 [Bacillus cereus]PFN06992.1 hypothetical protein COJ55_12425 [Bacillus cereus]PFO80510.1 hypothetical protein COJ77_17185 [Bacillus cereus]PFR20240.1 hypothetical protein COK19_23355 [Bacillus cereus]PGZ13553.1 hypothetical protein COE46_20730 [Bacillus cereus]